MFHRFGLYRVNSLHSFISQTEIHTGPSLGVFETWVRLSYFGALVNTQVNVRQSLRKNDTFRLFRKVLSATPLHNFCGLVQISELKKPEMVFKCFIRFVLAQAAVTHGMELMTALFKVAQGMISTIMTASGLSALTDTTLPAEMVTIIEDVGFLESIPLWAITLLGSMFIWVLSLIMILTVYSRFFKLYLATAIAPIPMASFAGQPSSSIGVAFLKSYAAICLEGCIIVLACVIFSAFASTPPAIADDTLAAATIVWNYVGEVLFNMLVLVGCIKMSDRLIRELMGLG